MGGDELGHRSGGEHTPIELESRGSRRWKILSDCQWWISYGGAWQFQGNDEHGLLRSLNGRLIGVHKNVVQHCRNRVQRTTRLLVGT